MDFQLTWANGIMLLWVLAIASLITFAVHQGRKAKRLADKAREVSRNTHVSIHRLKLVSHDRGQQDVFHDIPLRMNKGFFIKDRKPFYIYWDGKEMWFSNNELSAFSADPAKNQFKANVTINMLSRHIKTNLEDPLQRSVTVEIDWVVAAS